MDGDNKLLRYQSNNSAMASAMGDDLSLRDLTHPTLNDSLKTHNAATFKLVKTGMAIEKEKTVYDFRVYIVVNAQTHFLLQLG